MAGSQRFFTAVTIFTLVLSLTSAEVSKTSFKVHVNPPQVQIPQFWPSSVTAIFVQPAAELVIIALDIDLETVCVQYIPTEITSLVSN